MGIIKYHYIPIIIIIIIGLYYYPNIAAIINKHLAAN